DPEYEHVVLHRVDLIRDGRVVDALANATVRVVQQEEELERQIYNGELTVSVVLEDVRPGDVLDYAWTVEGEHPALRGHLATYGWLAGFEPVDTIRFRVLWPKDRSVDWKTLAVRREPRSRELGDSLEYTWLVKRPDPVEWEERAPQDHPQLPLALVSSFKDWASVSRWAAENYSLPESLPQPIVALADRIRSQYETQEERLRAALSFVQREVRYYGIEVGARSLIPHPPEETLRRRFGDCKDKTQLLLALLRELGIAGAPVLVHSARGERIPTLLPSPSVFNHVIARVTLDRNRYFDATSTFEEGPLDELEAVDLGYGLEISTSGTRLVELPESNLDRPTVTVFEKSWVEVGKTVGHLEVETIFLGEDADRQRSRFHSQSTEDASRRALNFYADIDDDIELERPLEIEDDPVRNVFVIREFYRIPDYWNAHARDFNLWFIRSGFVRPEVVVRKTPLELGRTHIRHIIEFKIPTDWGITPEEIALNGTAFDFLYKRSYTGRVLRFDASLKSVKREVSPDQITAYLAELDRIDAELGYSIWEGTGPGTDRPLNPKALLGLGLLLGVGGLIWATRTLWIRQRQRAFLRRGRTMPGETPDAPLSVDDWETACQTAAKRSCPSCRSGTYSIVDTQPESLRFDSRRLTVARFRCNVCDNKTALYFELSAKEEVPMT
ncbi:MAG: DUF3857 domain-containing protein, partial [Myxococcota bacterium]